MTCHEQGGRSPLHAAAGYGMIAVLEVLVRYGAVVDAKTEEVRSMSESPTWCLPVICGSDL
jgi:hypothetical protein